jgi:hypothetical protein
MFLIDKKFRVGNPHETDFKPCNYSPILQEIHNYLRYNDITGAEYEEETALFQ